MSFLRRGAQLLAVATRASANRTLPARQLRAVPVWNQCQPVSALPRFQLRLYSSTEEPERGYKAASEPVVESEVSSNVEATGDAAAVTDATTASRATSNTTSATRAGDPEAASRSIYMGNIYFDITEDQIKELASQYGTVEKVRLMKDVRGFSRGYAFLTYETEQARESAISALDGYLYEGRRLVVAGLKPKVVQERPPNPPSSTIYVGNMSYDMTDRELNSLFRPLRGIKDVRVAIDRRTGQPRGFAHADFADVESAIRAKDKLNGHLVNGRPLKLDFARSFAPRNQEPSGDVDRSDLPPVGGN